MLKSETALYLYFVYYNTKKSLQQIQKSERAVSGSASVLPNPQAVGEKNNGRLVVREIGTQTHRSHDEDSDSSGKHYRYKNIYVFQFLVLCHRSIISFDFHFDYSFIKRFKNWFLI